MDKARAYANAAEALAPERDKAGKFRTYIVEGAGAPDAGSCIIPHS